MEAMALERKYTKYSKQNATGSAALASLESRGPWNCEEVYVDLTYNAELKTSATFILKPVRAATPVETDDPRPVSAPGS